MKWNVFARLLLLLFVSTVLGACEGSDPKKMVSDLQAAAKKSIEAKDFTAAETSLLEALKQTKEIVPPPKDTIASLHGDLTTVYVGQKKYEEAEKALRQQIEIRRAKKSDFADPLVADYRRLMEIHKQKGEKSMLPLLEELVKSLEGRPIKEPELFKKAEIELASSYAQAGEFHDALTLFEKAEELGMVVVVKTIQAKKLADDGQGSLAEVFFKEAGAKAMELDVKDPHRGMTLRAVAEFQQAQGRNDQAADFYKSAIASMKASRGVPPGTRATLYQGYAKALRAQSKRAKRKTKRRLKKRAKKFEKRAKRALKKKGQEEEPKIPEDASPFYRMHAEWGVSLN